MHASIIPTIIPYTCEDDRSDPAMAGLVMLSFGRAGEIPQRVLDCIPEADAKAICDMFSPATSAAVTEALWEEQSSGARVCTIRDGENGVEIKDRKDGTFELTIFDHAEGRTDDITAYRMKPSDFVRMAAATTAEAPSAVSEVTKAAVRYTKREGTDFIGRINEAVGEIDGCLDEGQEILADRLEDYRSAVSDLAALTLAQTIMADEQIAVLRRREEGENGQQANHS